MSGASVILRAVRVVGPALVLTAGMASAAPSFDEELPFRVGGAYDDTSVVKQDGSSFLCDVEASSGRAAVSECRIVLGGGAAKLDAKSNPRDWDVGGRGTVNEQEMLDIISGYFAASDCTVDARDEKKVYEDLLQAIAIGLDMEQAQAVAARADLEKAMNDTLGKLQANRAISMDLSGKFATLKACEG